MGLSCTMTRLLGVLVLALCLWASEAFLPRYAFQPHGWSSILTELGASRVNAKREKIKRNRENMRKFKTTGRKGTTRRKLLKKAQSAKERQAEAEFIAQCFTTVPPPNDEDRGSSKY